MVVSEGSGSPNGEFENVIRGGGSWLISEGDGDQVKGTRI